MSMETIVCDCTDPNFTIGNLGGFDACKGGIGLAKSAIFSTETKVDGTPQGLAYATVAPDQAFFDAQFNNPIIKDRWFKMDNILQFASPVVAPNTEEIDGEIFFLSDNGKTVSWAIVTNEANKMKNKIDSIVACAGNTLVSIVDSNKSWNGEADATTFKGRLMQSGSYFSQVEDGTKTTNQKLIVTFNWDESALESAVQYIPKSAMGGYDLSKDTNLIDAKIEYGVSALAAIPFYVHSDVGGINTLGEQNRLPLGGLTEANLEAVNITIPASPVVVSGVITEPTVGNYVYTYDAPIIAAQIISIRPIGWDLATPDYIEKSYDCKALVNSAALPSA